MAPPARRARCGGELRVDYFAPPGRPVEWFLRCRDCGGFGEVVATPEAAEALLKKGGGRCDRRI